MKLLGYYSHKLGVKQRISGVEKWRIERPILSLKENTDWLVEESMGIFDSKLGKKPVKEKEMQERLKFLKKYDIAWGSYHLNPFVHTYTMVIQDKINTKFVIDVDDNIFEIDAKNPVRLSLDEKHELYMQAIVVDSRYITTTTERLANLLREKRYYRPKESVVVIPNLISTKKYIPGFQDDKDKIVIGYAGGASHYDDLHESGIRDALEKIMHEYKNVHVVTAGIYFDKYLPKARYKYLEGANGDEWYDFYKTLKFDIGVAPLLKSNFTQCKSNIKWQEYSLMGIPTIASNTPPYSDCIKHGTNGYLTENTMEDWYKAIKAMIENETLRRKIGEKAKEEVINNWSLEKNWHKIKDGLEQLNALDIKD